MFTGRAVGANVPQDGDVAGIVDEFRYEYCVEPKRSDKLAEKIYYSINGSEYAKKHFSLDNCCTKYEQLFFRYSKRK